MSASGQAFSSIFTIPTFAFQYPATEMAPPSSLPPLADGLSGETEELNLGITLTDEALAGRLALARADATYQTESRLRVEYEARAGAEAEKVCSAIREFEQARSDYFSRVEIEVVQLALSIAGKILHREAQVDPMLVAALVQIALGQLKDGSTVSIRVRPEDAAPWRKHFSTSAHGLKVAVIEDAELPLRSCILETELGSANFSLDAQLKEVEQGFFDVLAQRR